MFKTPLSFTNNSVLRANNAIKTKLPGTYADYAYQGYQADELLGWDKFARTAFETYRDASYMPLPTASFQEFGAFFSDSNYNFLISESERLSKFPVHKQTLYETMMWAYSSKPPRSDPTDYARRDVRSPAVTKSYLDELNQLTLSRIVPETIMAQRQNAYFKKNRVLIGKNIPGDMIDSRARIGMDAVSMQPLDYFLP
jgi:hypothetical protein